MDEKKFNEFKKNMGYNLKRIRESKGLTQEDMEDNSGYSMDIKQYQAIEQGRSNITLKTFYKMCKKLDVHPAEIFKKMPFQ